MKKYIYILFTALLFVACANTQQEKQKVTNIGVAEAEKLVEEGIAILDVRTAGEVASGKIEGAINIDFYASDFKEQVAKLDKTKPILVYCKSGGRSAGGSDVMLELGFSEVYNLVGGYTKWSKTH